MFHRRTKHAEPDPQLKQLTDQNMALAQRLTKLADELLRSHQIKPPPPTQRQTPREGT